MKTFVLAIIMLCYLGGNTQTVISYDGNGNDQFGGAIGKGKITIKETADSVFFTLTRGTGLFDSLIVFYLDAQPGGIMSTSVLSGGTDKYLAATTGHNPATGRATLNFLPDFQPDGAITFDKDGGKFFFFANVGPFTITSEAATFTIEPSGTNSAPSYTQKVAKADIGLSGNLTFKFIGSYIGKSASRSNEAFGDPFNNYGRNAGTSSYNTYQVVSFNTFSASVLPVKLTDFKAAKVGSSANIAWSVAQENNIDDYQIQRSKDGITFSNIAFVKAKNSAAVGNYTYTDRMPMNGANYYRLSINEKGVKTYSTVVNLQFDGRTKQFSAFLNNNNTISMSIGGIQAGTYGLSVINSSGQVMMSKSIVYDGNSQNLQVQMPQRPTKGIYRVMLQSPSLKLHSSIIVQ